MNYSILLFSLFLSLHISSQCTLENVIVNVSDKIQLDAAIEQIDIYVFNKEVGSEPFKKLEHNLDSLGIDYNESTTNKYEKLVHSKSYVVIKPSEEEVSLISAISMKNKSVEVEYQLEKTETLEHVYQREMEIVEKKAKEIGMSLAKSQGCVLNQLKEIELISSETNRSSDNKTEVLPGWNMTIDFDTNRYLYKHFNYRLTFSVK